MNRDLLPELVTHMYWERKERFLLEQDTYVTWVLFAIEQGSFAYRIRDVEDTGEVGDLIVCPPRTAFHRSIRAALSFHAITFRFPAEVEEQALQALKGITKIKLPQSRRFLENTHALRQEAALSSPSVAFDKRKQHYFLDLWLIAMSVLAQSADRPSPAVDPMMRQVSDYLSRHAQESLQIREVARAFGLTPVQLIRRFHAAYATNPLHYLTELRMKKACALLLETDWTLDVIAHQCGYENGYYLSRVFTKQLGSSPSLYRQQHRL
ncbi:helix-turn-helix domain-containing protein [Paenibacillus hodogayensis]|uniref:Helix-turn-helix domain-containing protein n=1 Tax=Paenibacillus hodogayensis TaxID=279208 RepID=A0ABV5VZR3_9BACL